MKVGEDAAAAIATEAFRLFTGIPPDPNVFFATFASLGG